MRAVTRRATRTATRAAVVVAGVLALAGCEDRGPLTPAGERPDVQTPDAPEPVIESPSPGPG